MESNRHCTIKVEVPPPKICKVEDCNLPTTQKSQRGITDLCKKHRGKEYKIRYKKKCQEFQERFSCSPNPITCQSYPDLLQHVLARKRLELLKSPRLSGIFSLFQQARQEPNNRRDDRPVEVAADSKQGDELESGAPKHTIVKPQTISNSTTTAATDTKPGPSCDQEQNGKEPVDVLQTNPKNSLLGPTKDLTMLNDTKSAFCRTKAAGPDALISVRCGTTNTTSICK